MKPTLVIVALLGVALASCTMKPSAPSIAQAADRPAIGASDGVNPDVNILYNPSFELALSIGVVNCGTKPQATGNWQPYAQTSGVLPVRESSVVHNGSGKWAVSVAEPASGNCGGGYVYQDLPFPSNTSYTFSDWAMPASGDQYQDVYFGWGHGTGSTAGQSQIHVEPTQTEFDAWGQSKVGPAVSYGSWHLFSLAVDAVKLTSTLHVDGLSFGTTQVGASLGAYPITAMLGQVAGAPLTASQFYYDGVTLDASPHVKKANPSSVHQGATNQKVVLTGSNVSPGASVSISGSGIAVVSTTEQSATKATITIDVGSGAPLGAYDITMTTAGGSGTCTGCLTVIP